MFKVNCRKEKFELNTDNEQVVTDIATSAAIELLTESVPGRATCKVCYFNESGASIPELSIWFTTEVPQSYILEFRRALAGAAENLDILHEVLLLSPEGRAVTQ